MTVLDGAVSQWNRSAIESFAMGPADGSPAAIVIYRAAQWLAPIPIGWILLVIMRGSHWREIEQAPEIAPASPTGPGNVPA